MLLSKSQDVFQIIWKILRIFTFEMKYIQLSSQNLKVKSSRKSLQTRIKSKNPRKNFKKKMSKMSSSIFIGSLNNI